MTSIEERWTPDPAIAQTLRTRRLPIAQLSGPDRSWVVASLTVDGATVASIAERLSCSLRLVQQIKAEPMTQVALYALELQRKLEAERAARYVESGAAAAALRELSARTQDLISQRDALVGQVRRMNRRAA